jgi:hypothetical protein
MNPVRSEAMAPTSITIQRPNVPGFENWSAQCSARFFLDAIPNFAARTWMSLLHHHRKCHKITVDYMAVGAVFETGQG